MAKCSLEDLNLSKKADDINFASPSKVNTSLKIAVLIPARYNSSRFPGKALHKLGGVPMAQLVYSKCKSTGFDTFIVSDDERICKLGERSILTSVCENGTARCAEAAAQLLEYDAFINVQGDMPDVSVDIIRTVAQALHGDPLVTVYTKLPESERRNPDAVKLIHNETHAIWFCRAALSYGDQHLGVYGYHKNTLRVYGTLTKCKAEEDEGLEQLRWLYAGYKMRIVAVLFSGVEINSPDDVYRWEENRRMGCG